MPNFQAPSTRGYTLVWTWMPSANAWLRERRDGPAKPASAALHDLNATLIVQCAMFFDGLLASGLTNSMPRLGEEDSVEGRLAAEYHDRVHREYAFSKNVSLFKVVTGKSLADLLGNDQRWKSLDVLFKFRNGLAHGRLIEYRVYFDKATAQHEPDFSGNYSSVEKYLLEKTLLDVPVKEGGSGWPFLESKIADHFCELIRPLAYDIVGFFPDYAAKHLRCVLDDAFKQWPS